MNAFFTLVNPTFASFPIVFCCMLDKSLKLVWCLLIRPKFWSIISRIINWGCWGRPKSNFPLIELKMISSSAASTSIPRGHGGGSSNSLQAVGRSVQYESPLINLIARRKLFRDSRTSLASATSVSPPTPPVNGLRSGSFSGYDPLLDQATTSKDKKRRRSERLR